MNNPIINTGIFTWNGRGNIGDDWLSDVAHSLWPLSKKLYESRKLSISTSYKLRNINGIDRIILAGGGWLAADNPANLALTRWNAHSQENPIPLYSFGLGLGPFAFQTREALQLLESLQSPIVVRTKADQNHSFHLPTVLACDLALLDTSEFLVGASERIYKSKNRLSVISFPSYHSHWKLIRPWLTEFWYREYVMNLVRKLSQNQDLVFISFDSGKDIQYWKELQVPSYIPKSILEAAKIFQKVDSVISARLHCSLLAALMGKPQFSLAYHHKFDALSELGIYARGLSVEPHFDDFDIELASLNCLEDVRLRGMTVLREIQL